jgi:osmotically-inducible protein OsmY
MQARLAPLLFTDQDKATAEAAGPSPVAPAARSPRAAAKAAAKHTPAGLPVHSLTSLLADLATICLDQIQPADPALTGGVSTYAQKLAAVRAASRVYGVKAVADEMKVKLAGTPRDDSDIAQAIAHVLEWNTQIPEGKVHAQVRAGWVTLDGEVGWDYQRREVERMVRHVRGVVGITNNITVKPTVSPDQVQGKIEEAFRREAQIDARHISVQVSDHTAKLYGHVHSLKEANVATAAAASAPGVASVESHLVATPLSGFP